MDWERDFTSEPQEQIWEALLLISSPTKQAMLAEPHLQLGALARWRLCANLGEVFVLPDNKCHFTVNILSATEITANRYHYASSGVASLESNTHGFGGFGGNLSSTNNKHPNGRSWRFILCFRSPYSYREVDTAISALKHYASEICQMHHQIPQSQTCPHSLEQDKSWEH